MKRSVMWGWFGHVSFARTVRNLAIVPAVCAAALLTAAARGDAAVADCGRPLGSTTTTATDCLYMLRAAVDLESCALCTCDVDSNGDVVASDALLCLRFAVGQDVVLSCPPCVDCPEFAEWTTHSGIGEPCAVDDECPLGSCDQGIGRCRTASELELGWTGRAHNVDGNDGSVLRVAVECEGDGQACGSCAIGGLDPLPGDCRCANDARVACDSAFLADAGCPACSGGAFAGDACSEDAQCDGGSCGRFCAFDPGIACSTNTDCPFGRRLCPDELHCGDGLGNACAVNADCTGTCTASAVCECFESPPVPVASVDFPFCVVPRLAADVSGTVDVDSGASVVVKDVQLRAFGGVSLRTPCPVCGGTCSGNAMPCASDDDCAGGESCSADPVARDGVRGGTCVGGANDSEPCDVGATNASFPPDGGGGYSLDCMPEPDSNFTGTGLRGRLVETTGESSLPSLLDCDADGSGLARCPCLTCSGGSNMACRGDDECASLRSCTLLPEQGCQTNGDCEGFDLGTCTAFDGTRCSGSVFALCTTNADCVEVDFGSCDPATCSSPGEGVVPSPNDCTAGTCIEDGSGEGTCASGPDDKFCDGLVEADGSGVRRCSSDIDCSAQLLGFDAGACTLVERRPCFLEPILAQGAADPVHPLSVATWCVSPTTSLGANVSLGLPGPVRTRRQTSLQSTSVD